MTTIHDTPDTRANHEGRTCPPWCEISHDDQQIICVGSGDRHPGASGAPVWARATWHPDSWGGRRQVGLTGTVPDGNGPVFHVAFGTAREAAQMAGLAELLAAASPDQHRDLAAEIRAASAAVFGEVDR